MYIAHKYYVAENKRHPTAATTFIKRPGAIEEILNILRVHYGIRDKIEIFFRYSYDNISWYDPGHIYHFITFCWSYNETEKVYHLDMLTIVHEFAHFALEYRRRKSRRPHPVRCHSKAHRELVDECIRFLNMWGYWGRLIGGQNE